MNAFLSLPGTIETTHAPPATVTIAQYSRRAILALWAAAALPMGVLAWIVAPRLGGLFAGEGNVPFGKALILCMTLGLIWQFVLVAVLVYREQRTLRWATLREALWLGRPTSPGSGRSGGRVWLVLIPFALIFAAHGLLPELSHPEERDFGVLLGSEAGQEFLRGAWLWAAIIWTLMLFNTVLGEELLFRGFMLPRMQRAFGRGDWAANGVLFAAYHVHMPWSMLSPLLDAISLAFPTKRYRSAWIGIAVHSTQSVFLGLLVLTLVL